jgi:hypothetical protein
MKDEKGNFAKAISAAQKAGEKVVDEMVAEVAIPAEPEAMTAVAAVRAVGVTEVTWVEMEAERTEPVVAAERVPAMVVVVAIGRSLGRWLESSRRTS